jgi:hypothetical protein
MTDVTSTWSLPSDGAAWSDDGAVADQTDDGARGRGAWLRILLGAFAAYTVIALLTIAQAAYYVLNGGGPVPWRSLIAGRLLDNYACALFVPAFFWLVHRYPIDRQHWRRSIPLLLAASLFFTLVKFGLLLPINRALWTGPIGLFRSAQLGNSIGVLLDFWAVGRRSASGRQRNYGLSSPTHNSRRCAPSYTRTFFSTRSTAWPRSCIATPAAPTRC